MSTSKYLEKLRSDLHDTRDKLADERQKSKMLAEQWTAARAQLDAIQAARGEAVEVVAIAEGEGELPERCWRGLKWADRIDPVSVPVGSDLMTVAQHDRIVAALNATHTPTPQQISDYLNGLETIQREVAERDARRAAPPASGAVPVPRELLELAYQAVHALAGMKIDGYTEQQCADLRALLAKGGGQS